MKIKNIFTKILIVLAVLIISANFTYAIDETLCDDTCPGAEWVSTITEEVQYPGTNCTLRITYSWRWNECLNQCDFLIEEDGGIQLYPASCSTSVNPREVLEFAMEFVTMRMTVFPADARCFPTEDHHQTFNFYLKGCYKWEGDLGPSGEYAKLVPCASVGCCIYVVVVGLDDHGNLVFINMSHNVNSACIDPDSGCFTICEEE